MGVIVSLVDLANSLQQEVVNSVGNTLIELAEGKVIQEVGDHAPWTPAVTYATPRAVVLRAAGRPLRNPKGGTVKQVDAVRDEFPPERLGVYLDDDDVSELAGWLEWKTGAVAAGTGAPVGSFPDPLCYPDPARRTYRGSALTDYE